ncbi:Hsp33 family molecular chaperone HslO [Acanthopleuribacter pedis]|uniref:Hsp33 family molecular chaperone HslO n=1 Tax=Acanthopleuribacter pedis TaxID=442870 RepID=A0A8J7U375_9BACT|nr:Hsp33 family molecular chaperone HslO [Acanthopleuribacter pedis]MBO1318043.1 Hsp33 family molecular chaperone HslO [Acanthopleuribacter pedis]
MTEKIRRYMHEDGTFKVVLVESTLIGRAAYDRLACSPITLTLLTQAMTGALLLISDLKVETTTQLKFEGDGPMGYLVAEANSLGEVRGTAKDPATAFDPKPDVGLFQQAVGNGLLQVTRRIKGVDDLYNSVVHIEGEVAQTLSRYFLDSQQIPTGIRLGCKLDPEIGVKGAGGLMIQAMPGANENLLFVLENRLMELGDLGELFAAGNGEEAIMDFLFEDMPIKHLADTETRFHCGCSMERMVRVVAALPKDELEDLAKDPAGITINCNFCRTPFQIDRDTLLVLRDEK